MAFLARLRVLLPLALLVPASAQMTHPQHPAEILRDRWGIVHIYAHSQQDLFFVQGWMAAHDRLFQLDLWRRGGTGKLAEVLGPAWIARDRFARLMRYRGDMAKEWASYAPDAKEIVTAFTDGINQYIRMLHGTRPPEFKAAGFDPGLWQPEDCLSRLAGLAVSGNALREIARSEDVARFGLDTVKRLMPVTVQDALKPPDGVDLAAIDNDIVKEYLAAIDPVSLRGEAPRTTAANIVEWNAEAQGSNNWVVDGTRTESGKPLLANDPHRQMTLPSLRKTWHLVAPGWDVIGAGEPALPGIALGHNQEIAFGFTTVGTDQQDLYVEKLNPDNADQYRYKGAWKDMDVVHEDIAVKGQDKPERVELRYTIHGPVIHVDAARHLAYALRWVGAEPGTAAYLGALSMARARNWDEFTSAAARFKVPAENMVYADRQGHIGWIATGLAPVRRNWSGLFPVAGDSGDHEWDGFVPAAEMPRSFDPPAHSIATANNDVLPQGYKWPLSYEFDPPDRYNRVRELLHRYSRIDMDYCESMQQDIVSLPARRFHEILKSWTAPEDLKPWLAEVLAWDGRMRVDSEAALIYETWMSKLPAALLGSALGPRVPREAVLATLEQKPDWQAVGGALYAALAEIEELLGKDRSAWRWGKLHSITFEHPLGVAKWDRGPFARGGDSNTVNATGGRNFKQSSGASYREIIDLADWDHSMTTNAPGESGDPRSRFYDNLIEDWEWGEYHPLLYTRPMIERFTVERMIYQPAEASH